MEITVQSANSAFIETLTELKRRGLTSEPRGFKIKEFTNFHLNILNPRDRIIRTPERKFNNAYAFGELAWYLSGRNDLETIAYYSKFANRCSDDGKTLNSAYGYRIFGSHPQITFNQWDKTVEKLRKDPDTRQAIICIYTPNDKETKDEVCTLSLQFLLRGGKLDLITTMRSNDIVLGFTYDVFCFTVLQELMANTLGVEVGEYHHNAGSMHVYVDGYYNKNLPDFMSDEVIESIQETKYSSKSMDKIKETRIQRFAANINQFEMIFRRAKSGGEFTGATTLLIENIWGICPFYTEAIKAFQEKAEERLGIKK